MKKGIGLIWALIILLLVSFMLVFITKVAFISQKHIGMSYAVQKGELFMQSCIENSLLAIEGYLRSSTNKCLENINFTNEKGDFNCSVRILRYYCYKDENCPCDNKKIIKTSFSNGYVLMEVTVKSNKYHINLSKTTLQRP